MIIDRNDIGILKDLRKEAFINEECENLKVVVNDGNYTRSINKKKQDGLQAYRFPLCDKCYR